MTFNKYDKEMIERSNEERAARKDELLDQYGKLMDARKLAGASGESIRQEIKALKQGGTNIKARVPSASTINRYEKERLGDDYPSRRKQFNVKANTAKATELSEQGLTTAQIAEQLGVSHSTIRSWFKRAGYSIRDQKKLALESSVSPIEALEAKTPNRGRPKAPRRSNPPSKPSESHTEQTRLSGFDSEALELVARFRSAYTDTEN